MNLFSWENNCVATNRTNGVDRKSLVSSSSIIPRFARGGLLNPSPGLAAELRLPSPFLPTLPSSGGSSGLVKSFVLPGNETGVVRPPCYR